MHAYLITGATLTARDEKVQELLKQFSVIDTILLETDKLHSIESIRNLRKKLSFASKNNRAVVIKEANLLTTEAANAFLKTLEEPPTNTIIILTAPNAQIVLDTISSRTTIIDLGTQKKDNVAKESQEELLNLLKSGIGERLKLLDELSDRGKAIEFCINQIHTARSLLIHKIERRTENKEQGISIIDFVCLIENLEQTRQNLEKNVNVKLSLGELLLHYPKTDLSLKE